MIRGVGFHLSIVVALQLVMLLVMWLSSLCTDVFKNLCPFCEIFWKIYADFVSFAGAADHRQKIYVRGIRGPNVGTEAVVQRDSSRWLMRHVANVTTTYCFVLWITKRRHMLYKYNGRH